MITPPYYFSIVAAPITPDDECTQILYRGSLPAARNAPFLRRLGIRTLVYLRKKALKEDDQLVLWAGRQGIDLHWIQADKMSEEALGMDKEQVTDCLKILLHPLAYPIYLADVDGISHTTLVVACLRKLQGWHTDCIVNEIYRFEPDHDDLPIVPFITSYLSTSVPSKDDGGALALPPPPYPSWLWPLSSSPGSAGPSRQGSQLVGRADRAVSSSTPNASMSSGGSLPFPNPLTVRRHPSMRLGFGNVPAQPPPEKPPGLWRARSNTNASRAVSDKPRAPSPRDTLNSRSDSGEVDDKESTKGRHKVSFNDTTLASGFLTKSPLILPAAGLNVLRNKAQSDLAAESTGEPERQRSGSALSGGEDVVDEYALDDDDDDEAIDDDEEDYEEDEDEDEDEEEDEEEEEEDEEPPVSQYISALDLAGM